MHKAKRYNNTYRGYATFKKTSKQYQAEKTNGSDKIQPIVYNLEGLTESERTEEIVHIKHGYSIRSEANTLLKDKRIHSRKGVNESYYVVLAPTDTKITLRHLPVINESILNIHDSSKKGQIITYYKLTKNNLIYQSTFYKNDTTHSNIPLNVKKIECMSSEEKCNKQEFYITKGDILITGTELSYFRQYEYILFTKVDMKIKKSSCLLLTYVATPLVLQWLYIKNFCIYYTRRTRVQLPLICMYMLICL